MARRDRFAWDDGDVVINRSEDQSIEEQAETELLQEFADDEKLEAEAEAELTAELTAEDDR